MEKMLEAILLATLPEKVKEEAIEPIVILFNKEKGLMGEATTSIAGPTSGVYAGLCAMLPVAIKCMYPNNREKQKSTLDSIYKSVSVELGIK